MSTHSWQNQILIQPNPYVSTYPDLVLPPLYKLSREPDATFSITATISAILVEEQRHLLTPASCLTNPASLFAPTRLATSKFVPGCHLSTIMHTHVAFAQSLHGIPNVVDEQGLQIIISI